MKKILALLLVAVMCLMLLAACGSGNTSAPAADDKSNETTSTPAASGETNNTEEAEEDAEPEFEDEEIIIYLLYTSSYEQIEDVQEAINAISSERYGITVSLHGFGMGEYSTQLSLAISGGEQVDLAALTPIPGSNFSSVTASGRAMDISDLIETYCPDVITEMGDYINAFKLNGAIYGLPVARQKGSNLYYRYRMDLAEELGIHDMIQNAASFDDLDAIYEIVKNETDVAPIGGSRCLNGRANAFWSLDSFSMTAYDTIGDNLELVYGDENGNAKSVVEHDSYLYMVQKFAQWQDAGYVWGDTATNNEQTSTQLIESGLQFAEILATEFGNDKDGYSAAAVNYPVCYRKLGNGIVSTTSATIWSTFVPATSASPEAALTFLNALYTDADLMNLIVHGIEGQHYMVNADGEAAFLDGANAASCGYGNADWIIGNSFILLPSEGNGADFRAAARADLKNSDVSPYMGFALDSVPMADLIAGLSSVYEEYGNAMLSGLYTESTYDEFVKKLYAAGLEDYIAGIQSQLDAWSGK